MTAPVLFAYGTLVCLLVAAAVGLLARDAVLEWRLARRERLAYRAAPEVGAPVHE
jgi:hypothetical protein